MIDFREKFAILGDLFGVRKRHAGDYRVLRPVRPPGFSDEELIKVLGRVPGQFSNAHVFDALQETRKRLLDRAFEEMDRQKVLLKDQFDWLQQNCPAAIPPPISGSSERIYIAFNGAVPTTAAQVKMAVTTSINTLQQVLTPATTGITILEWGISFDGSAAAVPVNCELFANDVAITGATALTPTVFGCDATASLCVGGTAATCFNDGAVIEGTVANARMFDCQLIAPTNQYFKQWPLGREPYMPPSKALRVRTTAPAAVNAVSYVCWSE
jgi:hypothetical protein